MTAALCMLVAVAACSSDRVPPGPDAAVRTDGPIPSHLSVRDAVSVGVKDPTTQFWGFEVVVHNVGDTPVTLDRAALGREPSVPPPVLVRAAIVGPDRSIGGGDPSFLHAPLHPLRGQVLKPQTALTQRERGFGYLVMLRMHAGTAQKTYTSFTRGVRLYYHDRSGQRYVAFFNVQYVVCLSLKSCDVPTPPASSPASR